MKGPLCTWVVVFPVFELCCLRNFLRSFVRPRKEKAAYEVRIQPYFRNLILELMLAPGVGLSDTNGALSTVLVNDID